MMRMEEWKEYRIGETSIMLIDGDRGKNYPSQNEFSSIGYCLFLNAGNVTKNGFSFEDNSFITKEKDNLLRNGKLERGDVVITTRGTVGNVALYKNGIPYEHMRINSGMLIVRGGDDLNSEYLYYYIKSQLFQNQIQQMKSGSAQPQLPKSTVNNMIIRYPESLPTQRKIASILSSLDDKIEVNRRINEELEELAQALFKSWFVDFEPFKDGEFVESELGMIPKGWKVGTLGDITSEQKIKVGNRDDVKVLSPITTGDLVLSEEFFTKQVYSKSIAKYLVVKPLDFAYNPARVNIGSLGMNEFDFDGCVSPVYVVFRCNEGYNYFFDLYRKRQSFKDEVISRAIGGVRQTLGYKDFSMISVVYPPIEIVKDFNQTYIRLKDVIANNQQEITHLTALRDTLLPKLMSGELSVDGVLID